MRCGPQARSTCAITSSRRTASTMPDRRVRGPPPAVRRPLVYRAIETLTGMDLVRPKGTVTSRAGPQRTVLDVTPAGRRAVTRWLREPVPHVRDARSMLMLKLLFLSHREADPGPLLRAQRDCYRALAERLSATAEDGEGFERTLALWRLETTRAAL